MYIYISTNRDNKVINAHYLALSNKAIRTSYASK